MNTETRFKVQKCNANPEVIKLVNGRADEIVREFSREDDALVFASILNARTKSIEDFKEFSQKEIDPTDYVFEITDEGFAITRKDGTPRIGALVAHAITFSEASHNFKWSIYKNIGVQILCYY